jgi:hypothetical protein
MMMEVKGTSTVNSAREGINFTTLDQQWQVGNTLRTRIYGASAILSHSMDTTHQYKNVYPKM